MPYVESQIEGDRLSSLGFRANERTFNLPNENPVILESPEQNWTPDQVEQVLPEKSIDFNKMAIDNFEVNQYIKGGATGYNSGTGWWIGRDSDGTAKMFFGNSSGNKVTWDGTTLSVSGTLTAGSIHIPDQDTTTNSFHVDNAGNAWWGCNNADFTSDNDNATAYVLKTGASKFFNLEVAGISNSFYGDGSDGTLTVASGTTTLTANQVYQYKSISISAGATLTIGGALQGNPLFIKCQGDCTIEGKIDLKGMGAAGATTTNRTGNNVTFAGSAGTNGAKQGYDFLTTHDGNGGAGALGGTPGASGGGGAGSSAAGTSAGAAGSAAGGTGGTAWTSASNQLDSDYINYKKIITYGVASGGGEGGLYHYGGPTGGDADSAAGGAGGGCLILEVGGALDFDAGGEVDVMGDDGSVGVINTAASGGSGAGGGGGGAGGTALIIYNTLTDNSGTMTTTASSGGAAVTGGGGVAGAGGAGSAGNSLVMANINLS